MCNDDYLIHSDATRELEIAIRLEGIYHNKAGRLWLSNSIWQWRDSYHVN